MGLALTIIGDCQDLLSGGDVVPGLVVQVKGFELEPSLEVFQVQG